MSKDLWKRQWQRIVAIAGAVLGALFLFLGWFGVSGSDLTTEQIPFLASGAVGGLFLLGLATTLWLSADLRDEYLKLDDIHQVVEHLLKRERPPQDARLEPIIPEPQLVANGAGSSHDDTGSIATTPARPIRTRKR